MKKLSWLVLGFLGYVAAAQADTTYYVQSDNARVRAEPAFNAKVLASVEKGQKLVASSKEAGWVKVKVGDKEGYISALLLSTQPPLDKPNTVIKGDEPEIKQGVRRRASSFSSAAAARGLVDDEQKRDEKTEEATDYKAVKKMESLSIPKEEVNSFAPKTK